jgi:hypothetical protein
MGYCIEMDINDLIIPQKHVAKVLEAINALHKDQATIRKNGGGGASWCGGKETVSYSWVDQPPEGGFRTIAEAFNAWRYDVLTGENVTGNSGDCVVDSFQGEKMGDCPVLWSAIAKYVNPKAYILVVGEDGDQWKWIFKGGKFKELKGKVTFR